MEKEEENLAKNLNPNINYLINQNIPEGKKSFKVGYIHHPNGSFEKQIMIDGIILDYSIDMSSFYEAHRMGLGRQIKEDIAKHFLKCVSEMVGRYVTAPEVMAAEKLGYI
jgi:hypothetical protein